MAQVRRVVVYLEPPDYERLLSAAGLAPVSAYARSVLLAVLPPLKPPSQAELERELEPILQSPPATAPIERRECEHGIMEGYYCWRCRGKAIVKVRR